MGYVYIPQPVDLLNACACSIIFIRLLLNDGIKAYQRKAYWFPRGFLVLSALTLQFINYADYSCVDLSSGMGDITDKDVENFLKIQLIIDSGRLVICVFIAYLLPGLASSGLRSVWSDLGALALSVLTHIYYEITLVVNVHKRFPISVKDMAWFKAFSIIVFIAILLLVLLSISAVLAGKTIEIMMNEKVSSLLECCPDSRRPCRSVQDSRRPCRSVQDHVLKCWILVRCSQPQYVVARSALSSFVFLLVTVCITVFSIKWICIYRDDYETLPRLNKATLALQFVFALAGWIVVAVRCFIAVKYFPIDRCLKVEDFWTRTIIHFKYGLLKRPLFWEARNRNKTVFKFRLFSFLSPIISFVQRCIVIMSKVSCFLLSIIFCRIMFFCGQTINSPTEEFRSYRCLLDKIRMPEEKPENMWKANESAFMSTMKHLEQGYNSASEMTRIIMQRRMPAADGGEGTQVEEEKYFKYVGKRSWKMEAVSVIHLMLSRTNFEVVDAAFRACSQAWALMDFVETSDEEVNLFTLAADKEFQTLEKEWKKMRSVQSERVLITMRNRMEQDITNRIREGGSQDRLDNMQDSMDWIMAAANFSLNKTSQRVHRGSAQEIDNLKYLLANVIFDCWKEAQNKTIIEKCNKWAVEGKEPEIYNAAFIAGKARSVEVTCQTSGGNNAVPPDVVTDSGNNAVTTTMAAENGNNATVAEGEENEPSGGVTDSDNNAVTTTIAAENGNNATVADGEENEPSGDDTDGEENEPSGGDNNC